MKLVRGMKDSNIRSANLSKSLKRFQEKQNHKKAYEHHQNLADLEKSVYF